MKVYRTTDDKQMLADLIEKAESQGYLTTEDIMEAFAEQDAPEQLEEMFSMLQNAGVEIYDEKGDLPEEVPYDELEEEEELSTYHVADEVKSTLRGLEIAVAATVWVQYAKQSTSEFAETLLTLGSGVKVKRFQKAVRGPKKETPKGRVSVKEASRQSATARVLKKRTDS